MMNDKITYRLWGLFFPGNCEELRLPPLVTALALLPDWVSIVVQQHPERAHIMTHHAVVEGEAEAALLGPVTQKQLQLSHILLFP